MSESNINIDQLIMRLRNLLPGLEDGRQAHLKWRDCDQQYLDQNPHIGDRKFHAGMVKTYDNRLDTVRDAIKTLEQFGS